jgi:hypothetical protein
VVGSDLALERVLRNVEVGITMVVVTDPPGLLAMASSPLGAVEGRVDGAVVVVPGLGEALDIVVVFLHAQSQHELVVLDLVAVLELDRVAFREDLGDSDAV